MAQTTVTTYTCDGCSKEKKRGELRRFVLVEKKLDGEEVAEARTDLCVDCERKLHDGALARFFPQAEREKLAGIVR